MAKFNIGDNVLNSFNHVGIVTSISPKRGYVTVLYDKDLDEKHPQKIVYNNIGVMIAQGRTVSPLRSDIIIFISEEEARRVRYENEKFLLKHKVMKKIKSNRLTLEQLKAIMEVVNEGKKN